ncbi:MAG: ABC transporter permease [bacterium]|nr:ABC transporter permease [bacterium]MDE0353443.1 ABC transporter permease [bacterium]
MRLKRRRTTAARPGVVLGDQKVLGGTRFRSIIRALLVPLGVLVIWYAVTNAGWIGPEYLPPPHRLVEVFSTGFHYLAGKRVPFADGVYEATWVSTRMVLLGLAIGTPPGLVIGLAFGYSRLMRDLLEFSLDAIRPTPLLALLPLFLLWFGSDPSTGVALIAFGVFLILTIQVTEAVRNVPHIYVRASLTAGASRFHIYRTVVVPAILPHMMAGFRLAVVVSWGLVVAAEFMGAGVGLGWLMIGRSRYLDNAGILVIVFIFAALAILSDFLLRAAAKRFTRWSPRATASVSMVGEMLGSR